MHESYIIEPVGPSTIERTYPLAKVLIPALSERDWRQYCTSLILSGASLQTPEREEMVLARNAEGYVKGLCIYSIRNHMTFGRLIDVPFFITASAADAEGVAGELIDFLRAKCDVSVSSGIRFWSVAPDTWTRRLKQDDIARSDHGLFMPALATAAEIESALLAHGLGRAEAIDRLSR